MIKDVDARKLFTLFIGLSFVFDAIAIFQKEALYTYISLFWILASVICIVVDAWVTE